MKKALVFLLLATVLLASCTDDAILNRKERRLTGTWSIERVKFRQDWSLFADDVLGFYDGDRIEFHQDYFANYEDNSQRAIFDGDWALILERDLDDDRDIFIDMHFYDHVNDEWFNYFAEITFLTHRKLKMTVITNDGRYRFKLLKT